jgi:dynein heavy chain
VGASCDNDGRKKFDVWIREKIDSCGLIGMKIPAEGIVYDYLIDDGGIFDDRDDDEDEHKTKPIHWRNWMTDLPELLLTNDTKFSDIIGKQNSFISGI